MVECLKDSKIIQKQRSKKSVCKSRIEDGKICNASILNMSLKHWRNWFLRIISGVVMIALFIFIVYMGPLLILLLTLFLQISCFHEMNNIAHGVNKMPKSYSLRLLSWYFLICVNYFYYGEILKRHFFAFVDNIEWVRLVFKYHRFISFCFYFAGVVWFVLSLVKKYDAKQYSVLAWTHFFIVLIVIQSNMGFKNIFQGLIWFVVPVSMVICNDIMAFLFGRLFGRTPLIELSPKKTWEGFIGGGIATVVYGFVISYILCQYKYFVCPISYVNQSGMIKMITDCEPDDMFQLKNYTFSVNLVDVVRLEAILTVYPFIFHSFSLSIFSSVIGPFGGFFASGLKRAYKMKDFSDIIPGHGGIIDRSDCQYLMATFVNVYITSFIKIASPEKIFSKVSYLPPEQQLEFFYLLEDSLKSRNILENVYYNASRF